MGLLGTLFGTGKAREPLDPASPAAARLAACAAQLEPFLRKVGVPVELVPAADAVYAYLGTPPADFGMAWFADGREQSYATLKEEQGISQGRVRVLALALGKAYARHAREPRYAATLAGREVVVIPSEALAAAIRAALDQAVA